MDSYSAEREPGKEHIPLYPRGFIALRIVQLVLSVIIVGLTGFGVAGIPFNAIIFELFVALCTLITSIYLIVAEFGAPKIYNYWAILALDIYLLIFWLVAFALLASLVSVIYAYVGATYFYSDTDLDVTEAWAGCLAGAAALGGVEFALYITSLSMHSVMLHRHRKAGLHNRPVVPGSAPPAEKVAAVPTNQHQSMYVSPQQNVAPVYAPPNSGFAPPQGFDPARSGTPQNQAVYTPPPQQQPYYPPQSTPTPVSPQHTGGYQQTLPQQPIHQPIPQNTYEVPNNQHFPQ